MAIESNAHWVAAGMSTEELICRGYELAKRRGLKITAHISGGTFSLEKGFLKYLRETGRTDVRYLMQLGILDPHWVLIHGIHATELDIEQMARVGCSFVYTPTSESIRGGGISPFANAHRAGVNVALGTDGPMVDYSVDMVEQMKVCTLMQHVRHLDPTRMPVETQPRDGDDQRRQGARARTEIGSLEPGKRADIAIFDLSKPYVGVMHRPLSSFVTAGKGSDARAVLVDGRVVYRDGKFDGLADPQGAIAEAERIGRSIVDQGRPEPPPCAGLADVTQGRRKPRVAPRSCCYSRKGTRPMDVLVEGVTQIWGGKRTQVVALDRFSHRFRSGRFSCVLGPSGCGKSTLIQIVGGLEQATSGTRAHPGPSKGRPPARARRGFGDGLAESQPVPLAQRHRQHRLWARNARHGAQASATSALARSSPRSACAASSVTFPASYRAACASAWRSRARSSWSGRSC